MGPREGLVWRSGRRFRPSPSNFLSSSTFFTFGDRALFSGAEKAWGYDGSTQGNQSEVVRRRAGNLPHAPTCGCSCGVCPRTPRAVPGRIGWSRRTLRQNCRSRSVHPGRGNWLRSCTTHSWLYAAKLAADLVVVSGLMVAGDNAMQ